MLIMCGDLSVAIGIFLTLSIVICFLYISLAFNHHHCQNPFLNQMNQMENQKFEERPTILAMKGHPGTGKSTLAYSIAKTLKCPLIDKDHFKDCTKPLQQVFMQSSLTKATRLLNDLSYDAMWQVASTQLDLGLNVVIDSPLSRRAHLDRILKLAARSGARVVIVECKPKDEAEWCRRLEQRNEVDGSSWHKPSTWREMEKLLEGYEGCWDFDVGEVPRLVVDTTAANKGVEEMVSSVLKFLYACDHKRVGGIAGTALTENFR